MNYADILKQFAKGKSRTAIINAATATVPTAAAVNSGALTILMSTSQLGTTYPNTLVGFHESKKPSADMMHLFNFMMPNTAGRGSAFVRLYRLGTLNLAASGNQFTRDSWTAPLLRKKFGQANQPVALIPIIQVTTATSGTAPVIRLEASGGGAGYTDQDGNATVGNVDFTFPAVATAISSWYRLRLNNDDIAVTNINQINVVTPASTGAGVIWLMELINPAQSAVALPCFFDAVFGSAFAPVNMNPAIPTSGSVTSILAGMGQMTTSESRYGFDVAVEAL